MTRITSVTPWQERMLGFLGLFLIGLIGALADRFATARQSGEAVQRHAPQR
jgi:hypothetical protein